MGTLSIRTRFPMREWPQMDEFIKVTHGAEHVLRNRALFDWLFVRGDDRECANVLVAYDDDRLVSLLGYIPTTFRWDTEEIGGTWMAHWMTLEEHRHGIGALLMKRICELYPIVAGQGASDMNRVIVEKLGFRFIERIAKVVFVFNPATLESVFGYRASRGRRDPAAPAATELTQVTVRCYHPDWPQYPALRFGTLRDAAYLTHRYVEYPFLDYHVFMEGEAVSPAVCIARVARTNVGVQIGRIVEFFFPETEVGRQQARALAAKCLSWFEAQGCDYADFYSTATAHIDLLLEAGFVREDDGALPSDIDPVDLTRRIQNAEVWVNPALRRAYPGCEEAFVVSRADGDQDRPNASFGRSMKADQ